MGSKTTAAAVVAASSSPIHIVIEVTVMTYENSA